MKPPKIVYLITRAHGLRRHLLKTEDYLGMVKAGNVAEMVGFLSKSDYSAELGKFPAKELDAYLLETIFYHKLSDRFSTIIQISSERVGQALEQYYQKLEVEDIKRIIRAKHEKAEITEKQLIPIPRKYQNVNLQALSEAHTMSEMIDFLRVTPYGVLRDKVDLYYEYNNPLVLEAAAEKVYYRNLWRKLKDVLKRDEILGLLGTEIDLKNLLLIFSSKHIKMERELIEELTMETHYRLSKNAITSMINVPYGDIPSLLTWQPYAMLAKKAVTLFKEGEFTEMENAFSRYIYSNAENLTLRKPNSLAYVFAYLDLCFRETKNLTTLAIGKQLRLDEQKIKNLLLLTA